MILRFVHRNSDRRGRPAIRVAGRFCRVRAMRPVLIRFQLCGTFLLQSFQVFLEILPMFSQSRIFSTYLLLLSLVVISGCGQAGPPIAATSGTITYQGKPVDNADVLFSSEEQFEGRNWPASAKTDKDGKYVLETTGIGKGALLGKHTVTITKRGPSPGAKPGSPAVGNETKPQFQAYMMPGPALIPEKYFSPMTSKLEAMVDSGGNTIDFALTD